MKTKITVWLITLVIITNVIFTPMTAHATTYYTGGLETWAATKIISTLYHLGGVTFDALTERSIWDGAKLDVNQLVQNATEYSSYMGYYLQNYISQYVAGRYSLTLDRTFWNLWKAYLRESFGVDTTVSTTFGSATMTIDPITAGTPFVLNWQRGSLRFVTTFTFPQDVYFITVGESYPTESWGTHYMYYGVFTKDALSNSEATQLLNNVSISGDELVLNVTEGSGAGYYLWGRMGESSLSFTSPVIFTSQTKYINLGSSYLGQTPSTYLNKIVEKIIQVRTVGSVVETTDVTAKPLTGTDGGAATDVGQDVLGLGNTATQEGDDVIIDGGLAISVPADVVLEDILEKLAEGTATYAEYVAALGAVAVKTEDTTVEDVLEDEKTLAIPAPTMSYTVSLNDLFPFCIPFDLHDMIKALAAAPVAPSAVITLPVSYNGSGFTWEEYTISLEPFDMVAQVVRVFEYIIFVVGLMMITRKLIEG